MPNTPPSFRSSPSVRTTWRNGGWLQESWSNRAVGRAKDEDPRAALRKCMVLSHLPIEVERALQQIPPPRSGPAPASPRRVDRRSPQLRAGLPFAPASAPRQAPSPDPRAIFDQPRAQAAGPTEALGVSGFLGAPSLFTVGALLMLLPPVGIFAVWSLPGYPRDGKVAASVGALLWMLMLGLWAAR